MLSIYLDATDVVLAHMHGFLAPVRPEQTRLIYIITLQSCSATHQDHLLAELVDGRDEVAEDLQRAVFPSAGEAPWNCHTRICLGRGNKNQPMCVWRPMILGVPDLCMS